MAKEDDVLYEINKIKFNCALPLHDAFLRKMVRKMQAWVSDRRALHRERLHSQFHVSSLMGESFFLDQHSWSLQHCRPQPRNPFIADLFLPEEEEFIEDALTPAPLKLPSLFDLPKK